MVQHWKPILNPGNRFRGLVLMPRIKSVEKPDDQTVRFEMRHPRPPLTRVLSGIWSTFGALFQNEFLQMLHRVFFAGLVRHSRAWVAVSTVQVERYPAC